MQKTKRDNELWYVQLVHNKVEIDIIPKSHASIYKQNYIFEDYEEAEKCAELIYEVYFETFQRRPYLDIDIINERFLELIEIELTISESLQEYPNFAGIDFCDVRAHGIQIRGHNKRNLGYCFGVQPTIKYNFSNYKECITEFIEGWKARDNEKTNDWDSRFIEQCEKWGFN